MGEFHFLRPGWLLVILAGVFLAWRLWKRVQLANDWVEEIDPGMLNALSMKSGNALSVWVFCGLILLWTIACVALAGPTWERQPRPSYGLYHDRVIVFDLSKSMDAADAGTSRIELAKFKLLDLVGAEKERYQSLVVFAGAAFLVAPLTDDTNTLLNLIPPLNTDTLPVQGSRASSGLQMALTQLDRVGAERGQIVLITDGVDRAAFEVAEQIKEKGHSLDLMPVGSAKGAPIPSSSGGLIKDARGNIVIAKLDNQELRELAAQGGGRYIPLSLDSTDIDSLNAPPRRLETLVFSDTVLSDSSALVWVDRGIWLVFPLIILALFAFRRGWILCILFCLNLPSEQAIGFGWADLWSRADQRAHEAIISDSPEQVPGNASSRWLGTASYQLEDYRRSADHYAKDKSADGHFNRGNALALSGQYAESIDAYETALEILPSFTDAQHNLDIVKQLQSQRADNRQSNSRQSENSEDQQSGNAEDADRPENSSKGVAGREEEQLDQNSAQQEQQSDQGDSSGRTESAQNTQQPTSGGSEESGEKGRQQGQDGELSNLRQVSEEQQRALEQWLKQVPDDPGGLLRRKFRYQYSQRPNSGGQSDSEAVQQW